MWKLNEEQTKLEFNIKVGELLDSKQSQDTNVEDTWTTYRDSLIGASDEICGFTKGSTRHRETWWWNDVVDLAIKEKKQQWLLCKAVNINKVYVYGSKA